jgi:hypothetical protein
LDDSRVVLDQLIGARELDRRPHCGSKHDLHDAAARDGRAHRERSP